VIVGDKRTVTGSCSNGRVRRPSAYERENLDNTSAAEPVGAADLC